MQIDGVATIGSGHSQGSRALSFLEFDGFHLDLGHRRFSKDDRPVRIGGRAFDILAYLAARAGQVVGKDELIKAVWPTTIVDEGSLRVHLVALRKVLSGDEGTTFIETVPSLGYKFVGEVKSADGSPSASPTPSNNMPRNLDRLVGRSSAVASVLARLGERRLVTLTGSGGIGKTSVAVDVARAASVGREAAYFVDLATLSSGDLIAPHIASMLGLGIYAASPLPAIVRVLKETDALFVFDNCEHVLRHASDAISALVDGTKRVSVLATSREALRLPGEDVLELPPLDLPEDGETVGRATDYPSIELFAERVRRVTDGIDFSSDENLRIARDIVRRLDGIPLAIELAASRVADLGLQELSDQITAPLRVLRKGRRNAPARQQTLRATLDWSYQSLSDGDAELLAALSVFAVPFSMQAAKAVAENGQEGASVEPGLRNLVSKSLLSQTDSGRFRLLETMREYASHKLAESGNERRAKLAHAEYVRYSVKAALDDWTRLTAPEWTHIHNGLAAELRSAIAWSAAHGELGLSIELAAISNVVWAQSGLLYEQLKVVGNAIASLPRLESVPLLMESQLRATYGGILYHGGRPDADQEAMENFRLAADLAKNAGDHIGFARASSGYCAILTTLGRYQEALDIGHVLDRDFDAVTNGAGSRVLAQNHHYLGQFPDCRARCNIAIEAVAGRSRGTLTSGANFDQRATAMMLLAKTSWIQGRTSEALSQIEEAVADSLAKDHAITLCLVLATAACPIYFGMGKLDAARHHLELLHEFSRKHLFDRWQTWANGYDLLALPGSDFTSNLAYDKRGARVENLIVAAGTETGIEGIDWALEGEPGWCRAELLRLKGELVRPHDTDAARRLFAESIELARRQGAPVWELRSAISVADLEGGASSSAKRDIEKAMSAFVGGVPEPEQAAAIRALSH